MVDPFRGLARLARAPLLSNGEHLALSKFQGDQPHRSPLATHRHPVRRPHLSDLELFPTRLAGHLLAVCRHRYRHSRGRDHPPPVPSPSAAAAAGGAPGYLVCTCIGARNGPLSPSSEENPCLARKFASCWREAPSP